MSELRQYPLNKVFTAVVNRLVAIGDGDFAGFGTTIALLVHSDGKIEDLYDNEVSVDERHVRVEDGGERKWKGSSDRMIVKSRKNVAAVIMTDMEVQRIFKIIYNLMTATNQRDIFVEDNMFDKLMVDGKIQCERPVKVEVDEEADI